MEKKIFQAPMEIKSLDDGGYFEGYASVFRVQDSDGDVITRGAFKGSIESYKARGKMPKMLWQHRPSEIIGKWTELEEDEHGLKVKGTFILDVQRGREAYALAKAGELDAMSVGFKIADGGSINGTRGRIINKVDLWEISLVTWGANPAALMTDIKSVKDFERFLRDSGFSRKEALTIAGHGFRALSDSGNDDNGEILDSLNRLKTIIGG